MITPAYCALMARYNAWVNVRIYAAVAALDDSERKRDRGAFFGSMHETLNHLLWADRTWLGRFTREPFEVPDFGRGMHEHFDELRAARTSADAAMLAWAERVPQPWLDGALRYTSRVDGRTRELPGAVAAVHLFNHGTHHRRQLTTLMKQAGLDPGVTDVPWLPGLSRIVD